MPEVPHSALPGAPRRLGHAALRVIGTFKLAKGLLLLAAAIAMAKLLHKDVAAVVLRSIEAFGIDSQNRHVLRLLAKLDLVTDRRLVYMSLATSFYAALFLTEGVGLWLGKRWAEYFTTIVTASFLPLEVYELVHHATIPRGVVLLANGAILIYLIWRIRRERAC